MTAPLRLELPAPARGRIRVLDELKGLAIVLIILYHAGGVVAWNNSLHGDLGVDMFVILSGLGLALSSSAGGAGSFLLRRFARIFPAYWIVLTLFLVGGRWVLGNAYDRTDVVLHYLGLHGFFGDAHAMTINDSFWFISLLVYLYVVFALMRPLLGRPDWILLVGAVASLVPALLYLHAGQSGMYSHLALRVPGFFVGVLLGRLLKAGRLELPLSAALGAALFLFFFVPYANGVVFGSFWVGLALMAAYAFLVRRWLGEALRRGLCYLGDRSLEIYLLHQPLIRYYNTYLQARWLGVTAFSTTRLIVGMAVGLLVTLVLAEGLHELLRRIPGAGPRRSPGAA
jgi:peptidoglycan/LPS O-acetylase OafA/YrhL